MPDLESAIVICLQAFRLYLILLLLAASAAAIERPITPPALVPAPSAQYGAAIASDGDGYFAVWTDKRATNPEVWGTRIGRDGSLLDPTGIHLASADISQLSVIWSGTSYLAIWAQANAVWLVRVDRDGAIIDGPRVLVANAFPGLMAKNGTHVVVGYTTPLNEIRALFLDQDANVAGNVLLATRDVLVRDPAIAWNGTWFAAVWTAYRTPSAAEAVRFNLSSTIGAPQTLSTLNSEQPRIASDGDAFVVLAHHNQIGRYSAVRYTADLDHFTQSTSLPEPFSSNASILWTGTQYAIFADRGYSVTGGRLAPDGRLIDYGEILSLPITGSAPAPAAASNGTDVLVAWHGAFDQFKDVDVYGTFLSAATLQRETSRLLSASAPKQSFPAVANGGTNLLAVWAETSGVYAKRLRTDGTPLDAQPIRLHDREVVPAVVFNGSDYIVAWPEWPGSRTIVTRRVPRDGELRADGGGQLSELSEPIAMASDNATTILVAGSRAIRLHPDGAFRDIAPQVLTDASIGDVAIAPDYAGQFLIAWTETELVPPYYETPKPARIRGARVNASLFKLDWPALPIVDTPLAEDPAIAWNGSEWLVVWTDGALRGRHVTRDGLLSESASITGNAVRPSIVWDGRQYALGWHSRTRFYDPNVMHLGWLQRLGTPLYGHRTIGTSEFFTFAPVSLAPLATGSVAAVYARIAPEREYGGVTRAFIDVTAPVPPKRRAVR